DRLRILAEENLHELVPAVPRAWPSRLRELLERALEDGDEVDRMAPLVCLLHPLRVGVLGGEAREHRLGALPAGGVESLERLVREVEDVAAADVAVIG